MRRTFEVVIEKDESGWLIGSLASLPGCHTQARSLKQLRARIKEAIQLYLDVKGAPPLAIRFVGVERVQVAS